MKRICAVLIIVLLCLPLCAAKELMRSGGQWNGRYWNSLDASSKVTFIQGLIEGIDLCSRQHPTFKDVKVSQEIIRGIFKSLTFLMPAEMSYGEISKHIDRYYNTPPNLDIPVVIIYHNIVMQARGKLSGKSEKENLDNWRKYYSK